MFCILVYTEKSSLRYFPKPLACITSVSCLEWIIRYGWLFIRMIVDEYLNLCPFDYTAFAVSWKVGIWLNKTSCWLSLLQLTNLRLSAIVVHVCNWGFWWRFVLSCCILFFFVGVGAFFIGLSQISTFVLVIYLHVTIILNVYHVWFHWNELCISVKNEKKSKNSTWKCLSPAANEPFFIFAFLAALRSPYKKIKHDIHQEY